MADYLTTSEERDRLESFLQEGIDEGVESREAGERLLNASIELARSYVDKITPEDSQRYAATCQLMLEKIREARALYDTVSDDFEAEVYGQFAHIQTCEGCAECHPWYVDQREAEEDDEEQSDEMDREDAEEGVEEQPEGNDLEDAEEGVEEQPEGNDLEENDGMPEFLEQLMQGITSSQLQAAVTVQQDLGERLGEVEDEEEMSAED